MNKSIEFNKFREKYKDFYYNSYEISEDDNSIYLKYNFEIKGLTVFNPELKIIKKDFRVKNIETNIIKNLAFHIGLIELISYWKSTCSPNVIIKCGYLNDEQKNWWKKLYFFGLGEMFYRNNIETSLEEFMNIQCTEKSNDLVYDRLNDDFSGYIVPIGGGKDSVVTLETLDINKKSDYCLIINPRPVTLKCAQIAGMENNVFEVYRKIDPNLIELNKNGFINGHTPFSAMLAFVSYFVAYLSGKKYIALSNENSANESNIEGEKINHQYSKSFEFEGDFRNYANRYLKVPIEYFSFLRPLNELQIAKLFSKQEKYHSVFKSCNVGSKEKEWKWCCNCAKCMFAFTILSPYLYKDKLVKIFGEDMFENKNMLKIFIDLTGNGDAKPFDCVGTFEEVNFAITKTIENMKDKPLPYLLKYYKKHFDLVDTSDDITKRYNNENNLTDEQNEILRKEVFCDD